MTAIREAQPRKSHAEDLQCSTNKIPPGARGDVLLSMTVFISRDPVQSLAGFLLRMLHSAPLDPGVQRVLENGRMRLVLSSSSYWVASCFREWLKASTGFFRTCRFYI